MRIVLTGATGFVGSEVLKQLLARPEVTGVTCLVRRTVELRHPKLQTVLHADFTVYDDGLARLLAQHSGVIWALGGKATDIPGSAEYERATVATTLAFAHAVAPCLAQPFHFCYLSGMGADPDETSTFPWQRLTRHLKGRAERGLESLTQAEPRFTAASFRAGGILPATTGVVTDWLLAPIAVRVDRLARVMVDEALTPGRAAYRVVHNGEIRRRGR